MARKVDAAKLSALVQKHEGRRSYAYQDTLGYWTIGIGRCIDEHKGPGLSPDEIEYLFKNDIKSATESCEKNIFFFPTLDEVRQAALIDMCFNMGIGKLLKFKAMLWGLQMKNWKVAANECMDSLYGRQLPSRAKTIARMLETGKWPDSLDA